MPERKATVASRVGLHARPASAVVEAAGRQDVPVMIAKEGAGPDGELGEPVNAASILGLMTLGAEQGQIVVLSADGDGAVRALDAVATVVETDIDDD